MSREAPRTLYTLTSQYQKNSEFIDYEVIVLDCGSVIPLSENMLSNYGPNFRLIRFDPSPSPAKAINMAVKECKGTYVTICIDGARMWSPGILSETLAILEKQPEAIVSTLSFHLGAEIQNEAIEKGYNQQQEDLLLEKINWKKNGYLLFEISVPDPSCANGWFLPNAESNCLTLSKKQFYNVGGMDERFNSPGGGLVNLDFFYKICLKEADIYILLGEGTFHQFHGGVSTNVSVSDHPWSIFNDEYRMIHGKDYTFPEYKPVFAGLLNSNTLSMLQYSYGKITQKLTMIEEANLALAVKSKEQEASMEKMQQQFVNEKNDLMIILTALQEKITSAELMIKNIISSKSWKMTRPFRFLSEAIRRFV